MPNYSYNSANELTSSTAGSYTYDANGNTLSDAQGRSYTWDFENRLTQAVVPGTNGGTTTFKYDPFGRRIQKSGPLGTTNYLYGETDAGRSAANVIEEVDNSGNVLARYVPNQSLGIDQPLAELRPGTTSYYEQDGLGSVTTLSTAAGTLANTYTYDSFGNLTASTGSVTNPFQYTGRDYDPETGLRYYRARYYSPAFGRFVSEDPIGFDGGDSNLYRYVWNSPINFRDPFGMWGVGATGGASAGGGAGWGGGSTGGAGIGVFGGGPGGVNVGVTGTTGSFGGGLNHGGAYPGFPGGGANGVVGGYAGFGGGGFVTNATSACQLQGPFDTTIVNFWVGEFQYSSSGNVKIGSLTFGPGVGAGLSYSSTTTASATLAGRSCGC